MQQPISYHHKENENRFTAFRRRWFYRDLRESLAPGARCAKNKSGLVNERKHYSLEEARTAKSHATEVFGSLAQLSGVGITRIGSGYGLKINLAQEPELTLPKEVDGVPVKIAITGRIRAQSTTGDT
jgi:hypothetical protein